MTDSFDFVELAADIVSAFVSNNTVRAGELPELISTVHATLASIGLPKPAEEEPAPELKPAVPIKKSMTDDYLICLDDGLKFKALKRHLAQLGMTPNEYRAKWGLPRDYPMVAPGYAAKRSELAKASGLGNIRKKVPELLRSTALSPTVDAPPTVKPEPEPVAVEAPVRRRGRPKKAA